MLPVIRTSGFIGKTVLLDSFDAPDAGVKLRDCYQNLGKPELVSLVTSLGVFNGNSRTK